MKKVIDKKSSQKGGAGVKLLVFLGILFLIANAGYQWIPVAYAGESLKQEMHAAVLQGMTLPPSAGNPADATKKRLERFAVANSIPIEAVIDVKKLKGSLQARVSYTKKVPLLPFGIYDYEYEFDHVETPLGFMNEAD